jgi:alkanesulfonate monooxygenase SsuD/methylene tetrahydromethanopterin reductase-like flavin-dependent oxidoreductase (luciferase family)
VTYSDARRTSKQADLCDSCAADTPGNAMDPWVAATMVAEATERARLAICVSNLISRHPAVSAAGQSVRADFDA